MRERGEREGKGGKEREGEERGNGQQKEKSVRQV